MPIEVELPDGNVAEFPDDMHPDDIASVLKKQFPAKTESKSFPTDPLEQAGFTPSPNFQPFGEPVPQVNRITGEIGAPEAPVDFKEQGLPRTAVDTLMSPFSIGGRFLNAAASDAGVTLGTGAAALKDRSTAPLKEIGPQGGNLLQFFKEPLEQETQTPQQKVLADISKSNPGTAIVGKIAGGLVESAPMLLAMPQGAVGKLIAAGFTADMLHAGGEAATMLGEEMGKPPEERDHDKITTALSTLAQSTAFAPLTAAHAGKEAVPTAVGKVSPRAEAFLRKTPTEAFNPSKAAISALAKELQKDATLPVGTNPEAVRRLGIRKPDVENVLNTPELQGLADRALQQGNKPVLAPGELPAIEQIRRELNPPRLEMTEPTRVAKEVEGGVLPSRERRGREVVAGEEVQRDLAIRSGLTEKEIDAGSLKVGDVATEAEALQARGYNELRRNKMTPEEKAKALSEPIPSPEADAASFWEMQDRIKAEADPAKKMQLYQEFGQQAELIKNRNPKSPGNPPERPTTESLSTGERRPLTDETPYEILDTQTGKVVFEGLYKNRSQIRQGAEKRNLNYGAHRYTARVKPGYHEGLKASEPTAYEIAEPPALDAVKKSVAELDAEFPGGLKVHVVDDYHLLPDSAHQTAFRQGANPMGIKGFVDGKNVYINRAMLDNVAEARQIWLHEQAGHFATDKILGKKLQNFMGQVHDSFVSDPLMRETRKLYTNADSVRLGREFVARLAENPKENPGVWNKVVAQFRSWLRDIGWVKTVSENDIRVLLSRAMDSLRRSEKGEAEPSLSLKSAKSDWLGKLDYSDVTGSPAEVSASQKKYADALSKQKPEAVDALSKKLRSDFEKAMAKVGIPISEFGKSQSWSLWDIGKQLYMEANPSKSGKGYRTANPFTDAQLQREMVNRMVGWEIERAGGVEKFSPSSKLSEIGAKAIADASGVKLAIKSAKEAADERFPASPTTPTGGGSGVPPTARPNVRQGSGNPPPGVTSPTATGAAGGATPRVTLDDIYNIFEPAPKAKVGLKQRAINIAEGFRTGVSSKFRPVNKLAEDIAKSYGLSKPKDIAGIMEQLKGSQGKAEADIYRFDQAVSKLVEGSEKDFNAYLFLRRSLDRLNQDAKDIATAQAGGNVPQLNRRAVGNYTINELTPKLEMLEAQLGPEKLAKFEEAAQQFQNHMDKALRLQVESGRMSTEVYNAIKDGNQFYAPFKVMKYLEESGKPQGASQRIDTMADFTKAMKGIEDPDFKLGDMLGAARQSITMSRILADKNVAMRNVAELAAFDTQGRFIKRLAPDQEPAQGFEAVNVLENGKQNRYQVNKDVAEAIQMSGPNAQNAIVRFLSKGSAPFRAGATALNVPFQFGNLFIADAPRSSLISKYGARGVSDLVNYPLHFVESFMSGMKANLFGVKDPLYLDFLDSGVAGGTIQEHLTPNALKFQEPSNITKSKKLANTVLHTIPRFAKAIEETNKILGVKRAMNFENAQSGEQLARQIPEAITELRRFSGSPDFGRQGKTIEAMRLNLIYMFLNARIQGAVADIGRLTGRDGAKTAASTWMKIAPAVAIPTAYLYYLNQRPEYKEDYDKRSQQEKNNYWLIPKDTFITNDDGEKMRDYWRIPKREVAKWFSNMTEAGLSFAQKRDPKAATDFGVSMLEEISPVNIQGNTAQERLESVAASLNPMIKAPLELASGRDMYRHRSVVPDQMQKASPEEQYTPRTAEAFKKLATAMPDVAPEFLRSPLVLENLTKNLTAGLLTQFLPRKPVEGRGSVENNPLLQRFQAIPYTDNTEFKEEVGQLEREAADEQLTRHRAAIALLDANKNAPIDKVLEKAPADEKLIRHVVDLYIAKENGITAPERQILALPTKQRAAYVANKLRDLNPEQQSQLIMDYARKRILTEEVFQQMPEVMK